MSVHEEPERPEIEIYLEMFDHLEDIVFCHDPDGRFLFMSPAAEKFLGYRSEDLPDLDFSQIIPTDYLEEVMRRTELQRRKQPVAQPWERQVFNRQGERVWVQIRSRFMMRRAICCGCTNTARFARHPLHESQRTHDRGAGLGNGDQGLPGEAHHHPGPFDPYPQGVGEQMTMTFCLGPHQGLP